jgi:putative PIN family toxin of toxin-antitoxin system
MIRVVLDTTVLVSAVISPVGPNAQVFDLVLTDKIRAYFTEALLEEYYGVFDYEHLRHLDRRRIAKLRGLLEAAGVKVKSPGRLRISSHEQDNRIYECAVAAKAHYIVTENTKHFTEPLQNNQDRNCPATAETAYLMAVKQCVIFTLEVTNCDLQAWAKMGRRQPVHRRLKARFGPIRSMNSLGVTIVVPLWLSGKSLVLPVIRKFTLPASAHS